MRILSVVNERDAAAGVFADPALAAGHELVEWLPEQEPVPKLDGFGAAFIFGGEQNVDEEERYPWLSDEKALVRELLERETPVLGVCLGGQLLAEAAGGVVRRAAEPEIGWHRITLTPEGRSDPLLGWLPESFEGLTWHNYEWLQAPRATTLASTDACLQALRLDGLPAWGVQFHPEVTLTDLNIWLDGFHKDPAATATGIDPEDLRADSTGRIAAWNDVGREISKRFLEAAVATQASGTRR